MGGGLWRWIGAGWVLLGLTGCIRPLQVQTANRVMLDAPVETRSRVAVDTPISTASRITLDSPPAEPLVEMPVGDGPADPGLPRVAIVDVDGLLLDQDATGPYSQGENPVSLFREKLDAVANNPAVVAVVVRINSPGGGVTATDIMWRDLQAFRARTHRPVVACLMDLGTGGAYYLATASDRIVAHPTTVTGGIGVILNLYNLRETMETLNILSQPIKAGGKIDMGSPTRKLGEEETKLLQAMADEFHERFQQVVRRARPGVREMKGSTFDGRVFTARHALERGLIDRIGYLDDALGLARELAHQPAAPVVVLHRRNDPAFSRYAVTPNVPLQGAAPFLGISVPGLDRSRLPSFLYLWQPEATLEHLGGK